MRTEKDPRFRATMDYFFFRIQTPYDVRARQHLLPTVGDTTSYYHSQSLANVFAWAARLFVQDAPDQAGRMMHAWKRCGSIAFGAHGLGLRAGWTQPLLMIDPDIPARSPVEPLKSERLPGYGAVLRNNYGSDRESYFLFKMGPADQHYDADEGSFHWYALGPSIPRLWFHVLAQHRTALAAQHPGLRSPTHLVPRGGDYLHFSFGRAFLRRPSAGQ